MVSIISSFMDSDAMEASTNLDFTKIFDDEGVNRLLPMQSCADTFNQRAPADSTADSLHAPGESVLDVPSGSSSTAEEPDEQPSVNVLLLVDPVAQKIICPQQYLSYDFGGKVEKAVVGPTVMSLSDGEFSNLVQQVQPGLPIAQPEQQPPQPQQDSQLHPASTDEEIDEASISIPPSLSPSESVASGYVSSRSSDDGQSLAFSTMISSSMSSEDIPPLRALSAYNFFFRDERDRILNGGHHDFSDEKLQKLLADHWCRDRTKKRRHRKTHGKIDFTTLSKLISQRWKDFPEEGKEFYRQVAARDLARYQAEMSDYKKKSGSTGHIPVVIG